jgi:Lon protease-like protein
MDIPSATGVIILQGVTLYPQGILPLYIFEPRYRRMLKDSLDTHRLFVVAPNRINTALEKPAPVAGVGLIRSAIEADDGTSNIVLHGFKRVRLGPVLQEEPYRIHQIEVIPEEESNPLKARALMHRVLDFLLERLRSGEPSMDNEAHLSEEPDSRAQIRSQLVELRNRENPDQVADLVGGFALKNPIHRQLVFESMDVTTRLQLIVRFLVDGEDV